MADDEIEGEGVEGEEDEEGGESEKEEEIKEEVKEEPKFPPYVPKIDPLTQVININRNLDMLNSEVNVISSEFMVLSSATGNQPKFYNIPTQSPYQAPIAAPAPPPISTPIPPRPASQTSYWNNPNHISLSPSKYAPAQNYANYPSFQYSAPAYTSPVRAASPYKASSPYRASSPVRPNLVSTYIPPPRVPVRPNYSQSYAPAAQDINYECTKLIRDIDNVLSNPVPPDPAQPIREYNTFDRDTGHAYAPQEQRVATEPQPEPEVVVVEHHNPPYPRNYSQKRPASITRIGDLYNRNPPDVQYRLQAGRSRSPLRNRREQSPHFRRPRSAARPPPVPATDFQINDAVKTLFR